MFFVNCFVHQNTHQFKDEVKDKTSGFTGTIINPWLALFTAWVFKTIML